MELLQGRALGSLGLIFSGEPEHIDAAFAFLRSRGVRVEVAGFRSAMSNRIMDAADRYLELDQFVERFRKEGGPGQPDEDDPDAFRERL